MPTPLVTGNLKTNKLTLQAKGVIDTGDLVMEVLNNEFTMSMGSNILLTVSPESVDDINNSSTQTNTVLTIVRDTVIDGTLTVKEDTHLEMECTIDSNLYVNQTAIIDTLEVNSASISSLEITSNLNVNDVATISSLEITSNLAITGASTFDGESTFAGDVTFDGTSTFAVASIFDGAATFNSSVSIENQSLLQYMFNSLTNPTGDATLKRPFVNINYSTLGYGGTYNPVSIYRTGQYGYEVTPKDNFINKSNVSRLKRFKTVNMRYGNGYNFLTPYSDEDIAAGKIYGAPDMTPSPYLIRPVFAPKVDGDLLIIDGENVIKVFNRYTQEYLWTFNPYLHFINTAYCPWSKNGVYMLTGPQITYFGTDFTMRSCCVTDTCIYVSMYSIGPKTIFKLNKLTGEIIWRYDALKGHPKYNNADGSPWNGLVPYPPNFYYNDPPYNTEPNTDNLFQLASVTHIKDITHIAGKSCPEGVLVLQKAVFINYATAVYSQDFLSHTEFFTNGGVIVCDASDCTYLAEFSSMPPFFKGGDLLDSKSFRPGSDIFLGKQPLINGTLFTDGNSNLGISKTTHPDTRLYLSTISYSSNYTINTLASHSALLGVNTAVEIQFGTNPLGTLPSRSFNNGSILPAPESVTLGPTFATSPYYPNGSACLGVINPNGPVNTEYPNIVNTINPWFNMFFKPIYPGKQLPNGSLTYVDGTNNVFDPVDPQPNNNPHNLKDILRFTFDGFIGREGEGISPNDPHYIGPTVFGPMELGALISSLYPMADAPPIITTYILPSIAIVIDEWWMGKCFNPATLDEWKQRPDVAAKLNANVLAALALQFGFINSLQTANNFQGIFPDPADNATASLWYAIIAYDGIQEDVYVNCTKDSALNKSFIYPIIDNLVQGPLLYKEDGFDLRILGLSDSTAGRKKPLWAGFTLGDSLANPSNSNSYVSTGYAGNYVVDNETMPYTLPHKLQFNIDLNLPFDFGNSLTNKNGEIFDVTKFYSGVNTLTGSNIVVRGSDFIGKVPFQVYIKTYFDTQIGTYRFGDDLPTGNDTNGIPWLASSNIKFYSDREAHAFNYTGSSSWHQNATWVPPNINFPHGQIVCGTANAYSMPYDEESYVVGLGGPYQLLFLQKQIETLHDLYQDLENTSVTPVTFNKANLEFNQDFNAYSSRITQPLLDKYTIPLQGTTFVSQLSNVRSLYNDFLAASPSKLSSLNALYSSLQLLDTELKKVQRKIQKSPRGNRALTSSIVSIDPSISYFDTKSSNTYLNVNWYLPGVGYDVYNDAYPNGSLLGTSRYSDVITPYMATRGMNADFNQRPYLMSYTNVNSTVNNFTPGQNIMTHDVIVGVNKLNTVFVVDFNATSNGQLVASAINALDGTGSNINYNAITSKTLPNYKTINFGFMGTAYIGNIGGSFCSSFDSDALYQSALNYNDGWNVYPNRLADFKTGGNVWGSDGSKFVAGDSNAMIPSFTSYVNKIVTNPYNPDFGKVVWMSAQKPRVGNMCGTYNNNGIVYFFDASGRLYTVDADTGERLHIIDESDTNGMAPPLVVDGVLYKATATWIPYMQALDVENQKNRYVTNLEIYTIDGN